ncbi:phenylalanine--tRNA ligase subunit beta [Buchnera aphidicola]|uniref:Phenylalanine--tRNA ligase beta subunit n=1 Tax=Buchnera aphidicola str. USDA (Myzus persicae) TaxID=1009856 RepID=W0P4F4_BUCMP|nr:phenylalanine--tRNA ligase subunit beta [Buchnera aphidicola]AHG60240.1 Phet [Buchnera aphidicola str. USDA (Myzus persicae)]AHG60818.1 Phet [Buchnera aphidicola str. W106 (Myzus persicae)]AHG61390.1 Phet [Buchnera aphidicola str. G002 (Myzus persicae)]AHG61963.1 Phet [Buchnera aphidicola str. F009 (Myzus persicae)]WAI03071.1 MAG: phenylalanine--tRNA ligase subunit beta [Buchnera aphidicola (Myzus persicae)]
MKFSEKWLREWIKFKLDSFVLYDQISNSGIEVESITKFEPMFNGVVVGQIVECILHPEFNKIKIVKVDIGNKKILSILCGAPNCRNNIKVAVATIGAILPKNIKIDKKIVRGELSEGMLCSFFELGLFETDQIIEFSKETPIGINIKDHLLLKDNIIKVSTTSNRPDGLSILGIARNITAINNLKRVSLKNKLIPIMSQKKIDIVINTEKESINYIGRIIENINVNVDTPFWMKKKLFLSDCLSGNIITDIINYVLIELGQPLNALDSDHINSHIIIRMAKSEEKIFLKDNIQISLNENILVFSDTNKILSMPGNINSFLVDVNKNTKNIFLSACIVKKEIIFHMMKKISSNKILEYHNYGIDPFLQKYALEYATDLIIQICGGKAGSINKKNNLNSLRSLPIKKSIRLHHEKLNKIVGVFFNTVVVSDILSNLEYKLVSQEKKYWDVIPPSWRFDILIEEDIISDILRIYGYNSVVLNPLKESLYITKKNESINLLIDKSDIILVNKGYYEVITYGFVNPQVQDLIFPNKKKLVLSNPISQDMSSMRLSLWPGLLKTVSYNTNRQQDSIRFFESGLCFSLDKEQNLGIKQEMFLSAVISGNHLKENWYSKIRKVDFYDLKGDLECILESICGLEDIEFRSKNINGLHPEQSAGIYFRNNFIGAIGAIDPRLEEKLNVNSATFLFEILLNNLLDVKKPLKVQEISKFPTSRRDIAILVSSDLAVSDIINTCKNFFINEIVEINLFDVYSCQEFSNEKKSLGISFIFQNKKRTFQDNEINLMMNDCIGALKKTFQVILRK